MPHDAQVSTFPELLSAELWQQFGARHHLTKRELAVVRLLCRGLGNNAIAARLGVQPPTLRTHLRALYRKLACHDRTQAVLTVIHSRDNHAGRVRV